MKNKKIEVTFLNMVIGSLVLAIKRFSKTRELMPVKVIEDFKLIKDIKKINNSDSMSQGIYQKGRKHYFIKTWHGNIKDLNYFMLAKEFNNSTILSEIYLKLTKNKDVRLPKIYGYIENRNTLSVIYEYIDGKSLEDLSLKNQILYLTKVEYFIREAGKKISVNNKFVVKKSASYYLQLLPVISLALIIKSPENTFNIVRSSSEIFLLGIKQLNSKLVLNHGDFSPDNFIVKGTKIYITDPENMSFTLPGFDLATIKAIDKYSNITKQIIDVANDKFIYKYSCLQLSIGSGTFMKINKSYLRKAIT